MAVTSIVCRGSQQVLVSAHAVAVAALEKRETFRPSLRETCCANRKVPATGAEKSNGVLTNVNG